MAPKWTNVKYCMLAGVVGTIVSASVSTISTHGASPSSINGDTDVSPRSSPVPSLTAPSSLHAVTLSVPSCPCKTDVDVMWFHWAFGGVVGVTALVGSAAVSSVVVAPPPARNFRVEPDVIIIRSTSVGSGVIPVA